MKTLVYIIALSFIFNRSTAQADIHPSPKQQKSILVMNGIAHVGNGKRIDNSVVAFRDGKLELVVDATTIRMDLTKYDTIIYAAGMHVYPGFIAANTTLGLAEMDAVRASDDLAEVGAYKPSVRSAIAYNTDSEIIPTVRSNGVLMAQITPRNGIICGTR